MRILTSTVRYALAFIFTLTLASLFAQVHYMPSKYGGYRTPIYGYQERDSTYRIIHSSQSDTHTSPFGGIFEINQNGEQTDELLTGGSKVSDACYDYRRGKLIISDNSGGGLWQSDAITHAVDWEKPGTTVLNISILPDGRIVGYRSPNGDIWVFDTLGNKIKEIPKPADCRYDGKFLPYGKNQFVNIGYMGNAADTLNGRFSVLFLLDSSLDIVKKVYLPDIKIIHDVQITQNSKIVISSTAITQTEWITDNFTKKWGCHLLFLIDTSGIVLWNDTISFWDDGRQIMSNKIAILANGNILHVSQGHGIRWLLFYRSSPDGVKIGEDSLSYEKLKGLGIGNPVSYCIPVSLEKTHDNGYYLVWRSPSSPYTYTFQSGCYAMKFDSLGNFWWPWSTGVKETPTIPHLVYPNPACNEITFNLSEPGDFTLTVTNPSGQVMYKGKVNNKATIETTTWGNGVYFYYINSPNKTCAGKFVKM